jgi:hypothetical protein
MGGGGGGGFGTGAAGGSGIIVLRWNGPAASVISGLTYTSTTDGGDQLLIIRSGTGTVTW